MLLVSLCFVAVMGIVLGSYLALTTRAMQLSNRGFQAELSKQLAEAGLDEALRAFNKNNWTNWTNGTAPNQTAVNGDITTYAASKRAVATITFPAAKFGQGATASVKLRIDNFDAHVLGAPWNSTKSYQIGDVVGYNGMWYSSVRDANTNNTPSDSGPFTWWVPAPMHWQWSVNKAASNNSSDTAYALYELMNYNGVWYRCITAAPALTAALIPSLPQNWSGSSIDYNPGDVVSRSNILYRLNTTTVQTSTASNGPPGGSWSTTIYWLPVIASQPWTASTVYALGDVVNYSDAQYRCTTAHTSAASFNAANWSSNLSPISFLWSSSTSYSKGSIVYYSGIWYHCREAVTGGSNPVADPNKWAPFLNSSGAIPTSPAAANRDPINATRYSVGDYVYRGGLWYRCTTSYTATASWDSSKWINTAHTSPYTTSTMPYISWAYRNFAPAYAFDDLVYHGTPTWRRYIYGTTSNTVATNNTYWEDALIDSWDWDSNVDYNIGDVVYLSGSFYRCIRAHTTSQSPPNTTYWSTEPLYSTYWDSGRSYNQYDTARYRGLWYLSLQNSNTNRPGTNTTWAAAPRSIEAWSSTKEYHVDDFVSSGGNWYLCLVDHLNQAVSNGTYWVQIEGLSRLWSASTAYAANSYVSYGGAWYKCLATNTGESPNNPTYWTPTWAQSSGVTTGAPVIYAEATVTLGDGTTSRTQLRAIIDPAPLFPNAAGSATTLAIGTAGGTVDSYDSALGKYTDQTPGHSAVLAAASSSASAITISNTTTVQGYLAQPTPGANISSNTTVWGATSPASPKVDTSRVSRSPYVPRPDITVQPRTTVTALPTPGTFSLGTPGSPTPSIYYDSGGLTLTTTLNINGPVILYVNGALRLSSGTIYINSTGSLVLYYTGRFRIESASNGIQNRTEDPKKLLLLSDNTTTTTQYYADSSFPFHGTIYMPTLASTLGLDIQGSTQIYGALSANEITFSSAANLHYDTSLRYATFAGVDQPYTVTEWRELPTTEAATMP